MVITSHYVDDIFSDVQQTDVLTARRDSRLRQKVDKPAARLMLNHLRTAVTHTRQGQVYEVCKK